ncbi:unnamed protein product [Paramecium sonneborni]|uniref:Uncharacterized protein n=1 Tax=Paramecium sonneborni TaxID=65129 RepID=A0A8S1KIT5_9CILI|nr:unnamed protein product [Paramecium sonneborni]
MKKDCNFCTDDPNNDIWIKEAREYQGLALNKMEGLINSKFFIINTKFNELIYFSDGEILRIEQNIDEFKRYEIQSNMEQIKHKIWIGKYKENLIKYGKWNALWKGQAVIGIGGHYLNDGKKQGLWKEMIINFWDDAEVYEEGVYINNYKIGTWKFLDYNTEIGGGIYNKDGMKNSKWIDICYTWQKLNKEVTYVGEYKNGKKYGIWYTRIDGNRFVGGGSYDENGMKNGSWVDIDDKWFKIFHEIYYIGKYARGLKIGNWNIKTSNDDIQGGGLFDKNGNKIGEWIEFLDNWLKFKRDIILKGQYLNNNKYGRWDIIEGNERIIGGGYYDQDGLENGSWINIDENWCRNFKEITYQGKYKQGKKIERWNIMLEEIQIIGGGEFNQNGYKQGNWICIDENWIKHEREVTYTGDYQNGMKIDRWVINQQDNQIIGQGQYDKNGLKNGIWQCLDNDWIRVIREVTYVGQFVNGVKIGTWKIMEGDNHIGGGSFEEDGRKNGKWVELCEEWRKQNRNVSYNGEYKMGIKIGKWNIFANENGQNKIIGGGQFNNQGMKENKWVELCDDWMDIKQITYNGEYIKGQKIGRWDIIENQNQLIGGGQYNQNGKKYGKWVELCHDWCSCSGFFLKQVTLNGEYKNGTKIGQWDYINANNVISGSETYNTNGIKIEEQ